ncbi:MAG: 30S ribosomal protein S1 [candidate division WOR-3 bacterium]
MEDNIIKYERVRKGDDADSLYDQVFPNLTVGQIVKGKVIRKLANGVIVDIGLKSEAFLSYDEFNNADEVREGDEVSVLLEQLENADGVPVISKRKADTKIAWAIFEEKMNSAEPISAKVLRKVKGGLIVELLSQEAFLPGSQIDVKPVFNFDALIGQTIDVRIISLNIAKQNIVVSRRAIIEEQLAQARQRVFSTIKVGDVVSATVTNIADFGVFVDIDGVDALLHISDLSWNKVFHPKELVNIGDKISVKVLTVDYENYRITVGRKQLEKHPWEDIEQKYPIGSKVKGKVTAIAEYGAFVELQKNVEGLIHVSEMSWTKTIHHPSQILKVGDEVQAVVLSIDRDNRRISLGLKQALPDPWSVIDEHYQIGQKVECVVIALKNFGAFVEVAPGIEGLIRNSDLSWTKRVRHPREVLKKNQKIEAIILEIDKENRQLLLGYKQTKEDPFYRLSSEFKVGDEISARIIERARLGIVVSLPYGIEGYVPRSQLVHKYDQKELKADEPLPYQVGNTINLKVTYIDFDLRKVGLSEKALFIESQKEERTKRKSPRKVADDSAQLAEEAEVSEKEPPKFTFSDHIADAELLLEENLIKKSKRKKKKEK